MKTSGDWRGRVLFLTSRFIFQNKCAQQEKTCSAMATFSTTPPRSITTFRRGFLRAHHIEAWLSFIVHGTSWNGAIVSRWVYFHSIPLIGNLQGPSSRTQSRLSTRGRGSPRRSGHVLIEPKCYWGKGKGVHDTAKESGIWGGAAAGLWLVACGCPEGLRGRCLEDRRTGRQPSPRYQPLQSSSRSSGKSYVTAPKTTHVLLQWLNGSNGLWVNECFTVTWQQKNSDMVQLLEKILNGLKFTF